MIDKTEPIFLPLYSKNRCTTQQTLHQEYVPIYISWSNKKTQQESYTVPSHPITHIKLSNAACLCNNSRQSAVCVFCCAKVPQLVDGFAMRSLMLDANLKRLELLHMRLYVTLWLSVRIHFAKNLCKLLGDCRNQGLQTWRVHIEGLWSACSAKMYIHNWGEEFSKRNIEKINVNIGNSS